MYTVKVAAKCADISAPTVYNYTKRFAKYFSPLATPEKGMVRLFSIDDIRLLAYLNFKLSHQKLTYEQVEQTLDSDPEEVNGYTNFEHPEPQAEETTQLVPRSELLSAKLLVEDARQREQQAQTKVDELQKQNAELQYKLGIAEGQLQTYKVPFWKRWFGGF